MKALPPGPFPAPGESRGEADLAVSWRDALFRRERLLAARHALAEALDGHLKRDERSAAAGCLQAWLDSWALEVLVEPACRAWAQRTDGAALAVLARAAEVFRAAHDLPTMGDGPWPAPPAEWLAEQGVEAVLSWHEHDGAAQAASALGVATEPCDPPLALPPLVRVRGEVLAGERAALSRRLVRGEVAAISLETPVPPDPASQLALGELRMEGGQRQESFERYGLAGLLAGATLRYDEVLQPAPKREVVDAPVPLARGAVLPGTPDDLLSGDSREVGYLLWAGPHSPLAVRPEAIAVLGQLDGKHGAAEIATALRAPPEAVAAVVAELCGVGAAGPPSG